MMPVTRTHAARRRKPRSHWHAGSLTTVTVTVITDAPGTEVTVTRTGRTVIIMMITVSDRHVTVQVLAKGPGPERLLP